MRYGALAMAAALAIAVSGCSMVQQAKDAQASVTQFHQMLDGAQYDAIYAGGAPGLRETPKPEFVTLMSGYRARMGAFQSAKLTNTSVSDNSQGSFTELTYAATYANGTATEKFTFQEVNGQQLLQEFSTHDIQTNGS